MPADLKPVEVIQADRDAALAAITCDSRGRYRIEQGKGDYHPLVQAFARHRLSAEERVRETWKVGAGAAIESLASAPPPADAGLIERIIEATPKYGGPGVGYVFTYKQARDMVHRALAAPRIEGTVRERLGDLLESIEGDLRSFGFNLTARNRAAEIWGETPIRTFADVLEAIKLLRSSTLPDSRGEGLEEAARVADEHVQRARNAIAKCNKWSSAQAEWSRARDLGLDIAEAIRALSDSPRDSDGGLK